MTAHEGRLDRKLRELNGERYAAEYVEKDRKPATKTQFDRYLASVPYLLTRKYNRGGILGVVEHGTNPGVFACMLPCNLSKHLHFRNPVQAACFYNMVVKDKFGEHAIPCDVDAVVRKYLWQVEKLRVTA